MTSYLTDYANIYYNAYYVNNNLTDNVVAEYNSYRNQPFLSNPSEYYMRIDRFNSSDLLLPIMIIDDTSLSVTINNSRAYVPIINNSSLPSSYGFIYDIAVFVEMVNQAFVSAHIASGVAGNAPILYYQDGVFSLLIDQQYQINGVEIWFNTLLGQKLSSFTLYYQSYTNNLTNGKVFRFTYYATPTNLLASFGSLAYSLYKIDQPYPSAFLLNEISRLIVTTSQMPTVREYITGLSASNVLVTLGILFAVPITDSFEATSQVIDYVPEQIKLIDMPTTEPLNIIDYKIYFQTDDGRLIPVYIEPKKSFNISFAFVHKSINDNAYTFNKLNL